jgi:Subtilase family
MHLTSGLIVRGHFSITFGRPGGAQAVVLRALLVKGQHRLAKSATTKLRLKVEEERTPETNTPRSTSPTPGGPSGVITSPPSGGGGPARIESTAETVSVTVGSLVTVALPAPLESLTAIDGPATGSEPGVSVELEGGEPLLSASAEAQPGEMSLVVEGTACASSECGRPFLLRIPVTVMPLGATPGSPLRGFTVASPDRVAAATQLPAGGARLSDELVVMLGSIEAPGSRAEAETVAAAVDGIVSAGDEGQGVYEIRWDSPQDLSGRRSELLAIPGVTDVSYSEVGTAGSEDVSPPGHWASDGDAVTWPLEQVRAPRAWEDNTGSAVKIGVVDEGYVARAHPDLDVIKTIGSGLPAGHATRVAGVACARGDSSFGLDVVGAAWGCPIVSAQLDADDSWKSAYESAVKVAATGARVVNLSLGINPRGTSAGRCASQQQLHEAEELSRPMAAEFRALFERTPGIVWTIAAGNACVPAVLSPMGIGGAGLENVVAVAATNSDRKLASFSNFGEGVKVAAPGGVGLGADGDGTIGIWSTSYNETTGTTNYADESGTSFAAPMVAGIAALVATAHPSFSGDQIAACIVSSAGTGGVGVVSERDDDYPAHFSNGPSFQGSIPIVNAAAAVACRPPASEGGASDAWTPTEAPLPADASGEYWGSELGSVSCPAAGYCVAVGTYVGGDDDRGLIETMHDGSWTASAAPQPPVVQAESLNEVACAAEGLCMAVGDCIYKCWPLTVTATLSGGSWQGEIPPVPSNAQVGNVAELWSTACEPDGGCLAVGNYEGADLRTRIVVERLEGGELRAEEAPLPTGAREFERFATISCPALGYCVMEGTYLDEGGVQHGLIDTLSYGTWTSREAPLPTGVGPDARSVTNSIACGARGSCVVMGLYEGAGGAWHGFLGRLAQGEWTAANAPWPPDAEVTPETTISFSSAGCAATGFCALAGSYEGINGNWQALLGTSDEGATTATELSFGDRDAAEWTEINRASCPAPGRCVVTGSYEEGEGIRQALVETLNGGAWTSSRPDLPPNAVVAAGETGLYSDDCAGTTSCVLVGRYVVDRDEEHALIETGELPP